MGKHASTLEELTRFAKKKLSALQLLMLLMPSPARKITLQVLCLLQQVSDCEETKMTPTTLGTIFAPIFFLNRKLDAQDMCTAVSKAEPSLAFMIEHAHLLFKVSHPYNYFTSFFTYVFLSKINDFVFVTLIYSFLFLCSPFFFFF